MEALDRLLAEHPFFEGMERPALTFLAGCARNQRVAEDDFLFREGQDAGTTLLVRRGRVALEVHDPSRGAVRLQTVEPGEVIGWSWLFPPYQWQFDARALEDTLLLAFDGGCLRKKCEADHELGYEVLRRLCKTVHHRLERTRIQLLDMYRAEGAG